MANEKMIKSRQQQKYDIEANWITAGNKGFIPMIGEIIVYIPDASHDYSRIKIGNGTNNVNELSFLDQKIWEQLSTMNYLTATDDGNGNIILGSSAMTSAEGVEF